MPVVRSDLVLNILGGGPAGLAAAYYAGKRRLAFRVYEAGEEVGGNCRTLRWGDFLFDTGAHRFHDRDPEVTAEMRLLLGDDLLEVHSPSQIRWNGTFIDFPLSPFDLLRKLDWPSAARIAGEVFRARVRGTSTPASFRDRAVAAYGETLAQTFLLNYSEKLWGEDPSRLSPEVAGKRLRGLDLGTLLIEALGGKQRKNAHLDGAFLYPRYGIGTIFDRVAEAVGPENIACGSRVTRLVHERGRIRRILVNGNLEIDGATVISTLPLTVALRQLDPPAPAELLEVANSMRFRHLVLGVFLLDRPRLSANASIYFPGEQPYTRIYESKNRSAQMAPARQTAVVLEIPCYADDAHWSMGEERLQLELRDSLVREGLVRDEEILGFRSVRVPFAYPVLEVGFEEKARLVADYLRSFQNLHLLGRSAQFQYSHIHDIFGQARSTVREIAGSQPGRLLPTA
ncbi:MAG: FAD-dependent oxidoreductase [Gemmatimonadetes bacterium]|nr:FAD-dependent oxidoreductase [Gemmatimonadota bacterium]